MTYVKFKEWLDEGDWLHKCFLKMKQNIEDYLEEVIKNNIADYGNIVCSKFQDVFSKCDEITYEEDGVTEAYILFHFLDRYHRFQLTYLKLIEDGLFPIKKKICALDIGTGPGPSLFALSDIIELYKKFEIEVLGKETIKEINLDYVECSHKFRNFLHHFTELANCKNKDWFYHIPYHHGSFYDMEELKFCDFDTHKTINYYGKNLGIKKRNGGYESRYFDIVTYSNFLTTEEVVSKFSRQIKESAFYLKNRGILLVAGANPNSDKYKLVYNKIDELILNQKYRNKFFCGSCIKVINSNCMNYCNSDIYGSELKQFYLDKINFITNENWAKIEDKICKKIKKWCSPDNSSNIKWYISVYKRRSYF